MDPEGCSDAIGSGPTRRTGLDAFVESAGTIDPVGEREAMARVEGALFAGRAQTPTRIDRYYILEQLGAGGIGVVYSAYDPRLDRKVALKLLRRRVISDAQERARFLREAQALAKLAHPNVIAIYDAGTVERDEGERAEGYIAMECAEGETLASWLERRHPRDEIVRAFVDAGRGLAAVHAAGLVHRDFKPSNVLISADGRVRVVDFGLARLVDEGALEPPPAGESQASLRPQALGSPVTLDGATLGTPAYMAPEQLSGAVVDTRADQFSFCVALFEALYGRRPFAGRSVEELLRAIEPRALEVPPDAIAAPEVHAALVRGLSAAPAQRFADMAALLAALSPPASAPPRRGIWAIATGGIVAGAIVIGLGRRDEPAAQCAAAADQLANVWDADVKLRVRAAFTATDRPYAADAWRGVELALDRYAIAWVEQSTEACAATMVDGSQSAAMHELRDACLATRRDELAALTELFANADADIVGRAVMAARGLTEANTCGPEQVASRAALPTDPGRADELERGRRLVARARATLAAGVFAEARRLAAEAAAISEALDEPDLRAEAMLAMGESESSLAEGDASQAALRQAVLAAARSQRDDIEVSALVMLARIIGHDLARTGEGLALAFAAGAAVVRAGEPVRSRARVHRVTGLVHKRAGDYAGAQQEFERALALVHDDDPFRIVVESDLGLVLKDVGRYAQARGHLAAARAANEATLGPRHPDLANDIANLALVALFEGQHAEARAMLDEAMTIFTANYPPTHTWLVYTHCNIAIVELELEDPAEARAHLELAEAAAGPHPDPAKALLLANVRVRVELAADDAARAFAVADTALSEARRFGSDPNTSVAMISLRATALGRLGRTAEARTAFGEALTLARASADSSLVIESELGLAELELDSGAPDAAREPAEDALARTLARETDPSYVARIRFVLARALWPTTAERPRARRLAEQAIETLERFEHRAAQRAQIARWLASRGVP